MREEKTNSRFEKKSRKEESKTLISAALALKAGCFEHATAAARAFGAGELSNSAGGKVTNWLVLIKEYEEYLARKEGNDYEGNDEGTVLNTITDGQIFGQDELAGVIEEMDVQTFTEFLNDLNDWLPARRISSLLQALRLPKRVLPILAGLLRDEAPTDNGMLRRYLEEKMVVLVRQLRPVELVSVGDLRTLCHRDCTDEAIEKMKDFDRTLELPTGEDTVAGDDIVIVGLYLDIESRLLEARPKLASKLAAGLLLRILSAATAVNPAVLDGHDGLKELVASVGCRSPRVFPTGSETGLMAGDDATNAAALPLESTLPAATSVAPPSAWVPPEQLVGLGTTSDGLVEECEWLDVGDEQDSPPALPRTAKAAAANVPPDSSISSSVAAFVAGKMGTAASQPMTTTGSFELPDPSSVSSLSSIGRFLEIATSSLAVNSEGSELAAQIDARRLELDSHNRLGKGTFSDVLAGVLDGKQPVAVKRLRGYCFEEEGKASFLKEMAVLQRAARECSRVCRFLGTVLIDEQPSLVMKRYPRSLRDLLGTFPSKRLPTGLAVELAFQLACALVELHALKPAILVLDLKPANLLLDEGGLLVVADFGVSKILSTTSTLGATLSTPGGTPYYMSPEHLQGSPSIGKPADIYGFAAVLYEMLVGSPPHSFLPNGRALNQIQIITKVCVEKALPAALDDGSLFSPELAGLTRRCLAFEPAERPTASGVRDALIEIKVCSPTAMEALEARRSGYDSGVRDAELRSEALLSSGEVQEGVPASERPWMVDLAEHLRTTLAAPRDEAFKTMRANMSMSATFACDPSVASKLAQLEADEATKEDEVVQRFKDRCHAANVALVTRLAQTASDEAAAAVTAIESLSTDPHDVQHRLSQRLRAFDVSDPDGVNSGALEGQFFLECCGPMIMPDDSAMTQLVALKTALAQELARSRQALFEALQKREKRAFDELDIRQCPQCKRGWSNAGGCSWRMCGSSYVGKGGNEMRLLGADLVFDVWEKRFDDDGNVVESRPTLKVERFFGVSRSEPFEVFHPKNNPATISERFTKMFGIDYDPDKIHHGCGFVGWFPDWKRVDFDDM